MPCLVVRFRASDAEIRMTMENLMNELAQKLSSQSARNPVEEPLSSVMGAILMRRSTAPGAAYLKILAKAINIDEPSYRKRGRGERRGSRDSSKQNTPLGRAEADILVHSDGSVDYF